MHLRPSSILLPILTCLLLAAGVRPGAAQSAPPYSLILRRQVESAPGQWVLRESREQWKPEDTAVIICDVWDSHHSKNAADRTAELAPRMNELAALARSRGSLIIHAPSDCMKSYEGHPARLRAQSAPAAANLPKGIDVWLHWKDEREKAAGYPIDHSDGGEDDSAEQLKAWHEELKSKGRNPAAPWLKEIETIRIDPDKDAISDRGVEVWNLLESRKIRNVLLFGVHTNMCVLGRPFGLRQLSLHGRNVVLVRDLTDTMYNPARRPQVSHFQGTDLIISHIERMVCPTVGSEQVLGGAPFHFAGDGRKHLVALIGEDEYKTAETLPAFLAAEAGGQFRITTILADAAPPREFPSWAPLKSADLVLVSVRRRPPTAEHLKMLKEYVASGKPVAGIRTASHAWALRGNAAAPDGHATWPEWDKEVLGGNYQDHYGNDDLAAIRPAAGAESHPVLRNLAQAKFTTHGSLYRNAPVPAGAQVLLLGEIAGKPEEPVAWTRTTSAGGRVFYTSLGHPGDFAEPAFRTLLANGLRWAAGVP